MSEEALNVKGMGWVRDFPDFRDFSPEQQDIPSRLQALGQTTSVKDMLKTVGIGVRARPTLPATVDLRSWCSAIEDQRNIGSCTAHAGVGLVEYFERRAFGRHIDASRLFLYKVTRNLLHWTGDTGAYLRTTMAAMVLFGVPPEEYWLYDPTKFDIDPSCFLYAFAQNYQAISYYRLDPPGTSPADLLARVKTHLAAGLPSMFGFTVYSSISQAGTSGKIPFPMPGERVLGGHAIDAVGFDDNMKMMKDCRRISHGKMARRNRAGSGQFADVVAE